MVVPHYTYQVLKMTTEKGILVVSVNVYTTYTCVEESFRVTGVVDLSVHMVETSGGANML